MPIIFTDSSPERRRAFEAGLRHLVQLGRVHAGLVIDPNPQPIYVLRLADLTQVAKVGNVARLVGWRYFAGEAAGEVVAGDVSESSPATVAGLITGDAAKRALEAARALETLPQAQDKSYELRLLRIPGALTQGFWLKPADNNGLFVRYGSSFGIEQDDGRPVPIDGFLGTLRPVGKQVLLRKDLPTRNA